MTTFESSVQINFQLAIVGNSNNGKLSYYYHYTIINFNSTDDNNTLEGNIKSDPCNSMKCENDAGCFMNFYGHAYCDCTPELTGISLCFK